MKFLKALKVLNKFEFQENNKTYIKKRCIRKINRELIRGKHILCAKKFIFYRSQYVVICLISYIRFAVKLCIAKRCDIN
jgi:hypothetical protein